MSRALAVGIGLAAALALAGSTVALAAGLGGWLAVAGGLARRSRGLIVLGCAALFGGAILAATGGLGAGRVFTAAFGAVLAADVGVFALGVDRDADPSVATARVELLHAVASATTALVTAGLGFAVYRGVPGGGSLGVVALLLGGVVLAALLGR